MLGFDLLGLQLEQSSGTTNVQVLGSRMGAIWNPYQFTLTRGMSLYVFSYTITTDMRASQYIRTAMTDELLQQEPEVEKLWMAGALLQRLGAPEDFKAPTVFLLAPGSSFMTGADLRIDGGHCASA